MTNYTQPPAPMATEPAHELPEPQKSRGWIFPTSAAVAAVAMFTIGWFIPTPMGDDEIPGDYDRCIEAIEFGEQIIEETGDSLDMAAEGIAAYLRDDAFGIRNSSDAIDENADRIGDLYPRYNAAKRGCGA